MEDFETVMHTMYMEKDSEITHYHWGDEVERPSHAVTPPRSTGKSAAPNNHCSPVCFILLLGGEGGEENWEWAGPPCRNSVCRREKILSLWQSRMRIAKKKPSGKIAVFLPGMSLGSEISTQYMRLNTCRPGPVIEVILSRKQKTNRELLVYLKKQITVILQLSWLELPREV